MMRQINHSFVLRAAIWLLLLAHTIASARDQQFDFEVSGNLQAQTVASAGIPEILGQPQLQVVIPGATASFSVVVASARQVSYQWRFNGGNIGGATNDAFLLPNAATTNEGQYSVVLVNSSGSVTSAPAALMIDTRGCGMPDSWQLAYFANLTNNATSDSDGDGIANLQEFLDGTDPANGNSAHYRLNVTRDGGSVIKIPDRTSYTNGETVTVTAISSGNYNFHAWTGDVLTRSNAVTLVMTNNKALFARFTPVVFTWVTLPGGNWDVATNWSPNLVPASNDTVIITSGANVVLNSSADCADVTLGSTGSTPTLGGNGTLTARGAFTWISGNMTGGGRTVVESGGTLIISNTSLLALNNRTLENGGTILCTGSGAIVFDTGVVSNRAGALLEVQGTTPFTFSSGADRIDNAGTFRKSVNSGTVAASSGVDFNNYGAVDVQAGTLTLGSGSASGTFNAAASAVVGFGGSGYSLNTGAQLGGGGRYRVSGTLTATANVTLQNLDLSGTLNGSGVVTVSNVLNWTGGTMSGTGRTIVAPGATLSVSNSSSVLLSSRTLENAGSATWAGNGVLSGDGAVLTNRIGAVFDVQNDSTFNFIINWRFDNAGTFRKSAGAGTTSFGTGVAFNNYGNVEIQTGTLLCGGACTNTGSVNLSVGTTNRLSGGGLVSGIFSAPATALVEFGGGVFTLTAGAQLNGGGLYRIPNGTVTCNTVVPVQNLDLLGTLNGSGFVTVSHLLNWTGGTMSGNGRTIIAPGATLSVSNSGSLFLGARTLENAGNATWNGTGNWAGDGALITNRVGALFEVRNDASFNFIANWRFDNAGTFRKSAGTGTTTFGTGVAFNNYGNVDLRAGTLAANGGYTSGNGASLNCAIGGPIDGTNFGRILVAGPVTLNGALSVVLTNGYLPATNNSFTILTAGTRNNTFASFTYPSNQVTMQLSNTPTSVIVLVTAVATTPPPTPVLLAPLLSGTNLLLTWTTVSNLTYRLEFNPDLSSSNWNAVLGDVTASGNSAAKFDSLTPSNRFYRVRVLP